VCEILESKVKIYQEHIFLRNNCVNVYNDTEKITIMNIIQTEIRERDNLC